MKPFAHPIPPYASPTVRDALVEIAVDDSSELSHWSSSDDILELGVFSTPPVPAVGAPPAAGEESKHHTTTSVTTTTIAAERAAMAAATTAAASVATPTAVVLNEASPTASPFPSVSASSSSSSSSWLSEDKLAVEIEKILSPEEQAALHRAADSSSTRARITEALRTAMVRFAKDELLRELREGSSSSEQPATGPADPAAHVPLEGPGGKSFIVDGDGHDVTNDDESIFPTGFNLFSPGTPMYATRKREHRIVKLHPVERQRSAELCNDGSIIIRDEDRFVFDRVHKRCPCVYKTIFLLWGSLFVALLVLFLPFFATAPFAILAFTDTSATLFGTNTSEVVLQAGNGSLITSTESLTQTLPWPEAWERASLWITTLFCAIQVVISAFDVIVVSSPAMLRRLATVHWTGMIPNIGFSWAYIVVAALVQPNPWHICWLITVKGNMPVVLYFYDAVAVGNHLRAHPQWSEKMFGKDDTGDGNKGRGVFKNCGKAGGLVAFFIVWVGLDIMRHYLVVNFGKDLTLITIENPISDGGRSFSWGARELASLLHWGSTLFFVQSFWTQLTNKSGRRTTVDTTNYEIVAGTSWRSRSVRLSHGGSNRGGRMGTALADWKRG